MRQKLSNWITITESRFSWEQDALTFIQQQFPPYDSYQAWANLEFIALDGSINEIDLLVFSPQGFFVIENELPRCKQTGYGRCFARKPTVSIATLNFSLQAAGN